ncbi:MAG: DUF3987 domain-containing protein [Singulisphaera sp.]
MLSSLREEKGRDDGFLERILFAFPDELAFPSQEWTENVISESAEGEWTEAIRRLAGRSMADQDEGRPRPTLVRFTPDAKAAWVEWWDTHAKEVEGPSFDESLAGTWSKLRAHAAVASADPRPGSNGPMTPSPTPIPPTSRPVRCAGPSA